MPYGRAALAPPLGPAPSLSDYYTFGAPDACTRAGAPCTQSSGCCGPPRTVSTRASVGRVRGQRSGVWTDPWSTATCFGRCGLVITSGQRAKGWRPSSLQAAWVWAGSNCVGLRACTQQHYCSRARARRLPMGPGGKAEHWAPPTHELQPPGSTVGHRDAAGRKATVCARWDPRRGALGTRAVGATRWEQSRHGSSIWPMPIC